MISKILLFSVQVCHVLRTVYTVLKKSIILRISLGRTGLGQMVHRRYHRMLV